VNVCIDIQSAIAQRAGVGRYTKCLAEHLARQVGRQAGDDQLTLFYLDFKRRGLPFPAAGAVDRGIQWLPGRLVQKAWKTIGWPAFDQLAGPADVYHFPNFVLPPLRRGRSIVTIHDVSFIRYPEAAEPKNLAYLNSQMRRTVDTADLILTDSHFSATEIIDALQVPEHKVQAVHLGLSDDHQPATSTDCAAMRAALNLDRPYLLFVGTVEPRKNIPFLIEAFEQMSDFDGDLVIAGMPGWKVEPIMERMRNSAKADRIRYLSYVDEHWLSALYSAAQLFVFPSLYEGFGFPPLEAMRCDTPVLASRRGSLPEVLGDAAAYETIDNATAWAATMQQLLTDTARRQALIEAGRQQANRYTWEETARQTWRHYREVGG
jgi:glycosyltransferase involved in cell wall biosynthesis